MTYMWRSSSPEGDSKDQQQASALPEHHPTYYLADEEGTCIFLVENDLFKVHTYPLTRESEVFRQMFTLPTACVEGRTDDAPVVLSGVTSAEFGCLMDFFYYGMYGEKQTSSDDWKKVLSIATRFAFDKVRQRAIDVLSTAISPAERIALAIQYDIPEEWLKTAYGELALRRQPPELWEAEMMGARATLIVGRTRERTRACYGKITDPPADYMQTWAQDQSLSILDYKF